MLHTTTHFITRTTAVIVFLMQQKIELLYYALLCIIWADNHNICYNKTLPPVLEILMSFLLLKNSFVLAKFLQGSAKSDKEMQNKVAVEPVGAVLLVGENSKYIAYSALIKKT